MLYALRCQAGELCRPYWGIVGWAQVFEIKGDPSMSGENRRCTRRLAAETYTSPKSQLWGVAVAPITPEIYAVLRKHMDEKSY